jgi:hypothetical protein
MELLYCEGCGDIIQDHEGGPRRLTERFLCAKCRGSGGESHPTGDQRSAAGIDLSGMGRDSGVPPFGLSAPMSGLPSFPPFGGIPRSEDDEPLRLLDARDLGDDDSDSSRDDLDDPSDREPLRLVAPGAESTVGRRPGIQNPFGELAEPARATFGCPHCARPLSIPRGAQDSRLTCPYCTGQVFIHRNGELSARAAPGPAGSSGTSVATRSEGAIAPVGRSGGPPPPAGFAGIRGYSEDRSAKAPAWKGQAREAPVDPAVSTSAIIERLPDGSVRSQETIDPSGVFGSPLRKRDDSRDDDGGSPRIGGSFRSQPGSGSFRSPPIGSPSPRPGFPGGTNHSIGSPGAPGALPPGTPPSAGPLAFTGGGVGSHGPRGSFSTRGSSSRGTEALTRELEDDPLGVRSTPPTTDSAIFDDDFGEFRAARRKDGSARQGNTGGREAPSAGASPNVGNAFSRPTVGPLAARGASGQAAYGPGASTPSISSNPSGAAAEVVPSTPPVRGGSAPRDARGALGSSSHAGKPGLALPVSLSDEPVDRALRRARRVFCLERAASVVFIAACIVVPVLVVSIADRLQQRPSDAIAKRGGPVKIFQVAGAITARGLERLFADPVDATTKRAHSTSDTAKESETPKSP